MLCGIPRLWNHKNLADSNQDAMCRKRPSKSSEPVQVDSGRRPSTSSIKSTMSIDWDPLRLHPSNTQGPAPPLPDPAMTERLSEHFPTPPQSPSGITLYSMPPTPMSASFPTHPPRQKAPTNTIIYGGFDFGFSHSHTPTPVLSRTATPTAHLAPAASATSAYRAPSPAPSDASSECSLALSGLSYDSSLIDEYADDQEPVGLAPAPTPRPRPRPRPSAAGLKEDDAEYFLRRGAWKRRGIVFVTPAEYKLADEEETFEF
ncbi:hypothetical protein VTJ83DRAFT_3894 [Remersonia thermophila]|uniref:Uncharacterized protein n=1 Tax=Remersonia thermophila TaxID=72144 RepID=A0ABR4DFA4_9PEZI